MKTPVSFHRFVWFSLLAILTFGSTAPAQQPEELKKRLRFAERELDHLRENLHEAQRELAAKGERIADLEKELAATQVRQKRGGASEARPSAAEPNEGGEKPRKMDSTATAKRESPKKGSVPRFDVAYDKNSAVNYEGREAALTWVREQLRKNPDLALKISGLANDSSYSEVNQLVAENRARYLGDFLVLSGVPKESITSVGGMPAKESGEGGRAVRIEIVGVSGKPEGAKRKKSR